jgi:hypothetical protein
MQVCAEQAPPARTLGADHHAQCWLHHEMAGALPDGLVSATKVGQ